MSDYNAGEAVAKYGLNILDFEKNAQQILKRYTEIAKAERDALARVPTLPPLPTPPPVRPVSASAEAARAARELARAQAEAARDAEKLAQEQQRTTRAVTEAARAEQVLARDTANATAAQDRAAVAAIRRQEAEARAAVAAIRRQEAEARAARQGQNRGLGPALPRTVESFGAGAIDQVKSALGGAVAGGLAGITVGVITGATVEAAKLGAQITKVDIAFAKLATQAGTSGSALISALREASGGEIDDLNLKLIANRANILGVADSAEKLAPLFALARDRAQALGISTTEALDSLITGLGRGSAELLDNVGITIRASEVYADYAKSIGKTASELTAAEQKAAVLQAVLKQAGDVQPPPTDEYAALGAALENAGQRASEIAANLLRIPAKVTTTVVVNVVNASGGGDAQNNTTEAIDKSRAAVVREAATVIEQASNDIGIGLQIPAERAERLATQLERLASSSVPAIRSTAESLAAVFVETRDYDALERALNALSGEDAAQSAARLTQVYGDNARAANERAAALAEMQEREALVAQLVDQVRQGAIDQAGAVAVLTSEYPKLAGEAEGIISSQLRIADAADAARRALVAQLRAAQTDQTRTTRAETAGGPGRRGNDVADFLKFIDDQKAAAQAQEEATLRNGTAAQKATVLQQRYNDAVRQYGKASAEAINAKADLDALNKPKAGGESKGVAALDQDTIDAASTLQGELDAVNALLAKGNLTVRQRNDLLEKQAKLQQQIADLTLDTALAAAQDERKRIDENRTLKENEEIIKGAQFSEEQKASARAENNVILLEQQKRARDLRRNIADIGGLPASPPAGTPAGPVAPAQPIPVAPAQPIPVLPVGPSVALAPQTITLIVNVDQAGRATVQGGAPGLTLDVLVRGAGLGAAAGVQP